MMMSGPDQVLSSKPALMSSPGEVYSQLYCTAENASVEWLENTGNWGNKIGLSSLSFGSSSQILLPNDQFLSHVVLRLQLEPLRDNEILPLGWGLAMLQSISWIMGASSSTSIVLQGDSIAQALLAQCKTAEMRQEMLELAGASLDGTVAANQGIRPEAYICLPLPFSAISDKIYPVDSTMVTNNIALNIIFNQAGSIYGGSAAVAAPRTAFTAAEVLLHQFKLGDQSASIRQKMIADPSTIYNLPVVHSQSFISAEFSGGQAGGALADVLLQSFANADLLGITFWVVETTNKFPTAAYGPRNPYVIDDISDLLVTFNGTTLFRFPGKSHHLASMLTQSDGAGRYTAPVYVTSAAGGGVPGFAPAGAGAAVPFQQCYPIYLDFTRARAAIQPEHLNNTWRIPNQQLQLQFHTSKDNNTKYRLYATYFYNMSISFSSGVSSLILA